MAVLVRSQVAREDVAEIACKYSDPRCQKKIRRRKYTEFWQQAIGAMILCSTRHRSQFNPDIVGNMTLKSRKAYFR